MTNQTTNLNSDKIIEEQLKSFKAIYHEAEIPKELNKMTNQTIKDTKKSTSSPAKKFGKYVAGICVGVTVLGTAMLNISPAFAEAASNIPLIGNIAQVLTVREYARHDDSAQITVQIPNVGNLSDAEFQKYINDQINQRTQGVLDTANKDAAERKAAFIATGGSEEGFMPVIIDVGYEIKNSTPEVLSFVVNCTETQANAFTTQYYYNLDLKTNKEISLEQMLGDNYVNLINQQVKTQIAERQKADPNNLYFEGDEGFTSIKDNQNFYINQAGKIMVVFDKYEIAPGYMGIQEFMINPTK